MRKNFPNFWDGKSLISFGGEDFQVSKKKPSIWEEAVQVFDQKKSKFLVRSFPSAEKLSKLLTTSFLSFWKDALQKAFKDDMFSMLLKRSSSSFWREKLLTRSASSFWKEAFYISEDKLYMSFQKQSLEGVYAAQEILQGEVLQAYDEKRSKHVWRSSRFWKKLSKSLGRCFPLFWIESFGASRVELSLHLEISSRSFWKETFEIFKEKLLKLLMIRFRSFWAKLCMLLRRKPFKALSF